MTAQKPKSAVVQLVTKRLEEATEQLGGLDDKHLKFLSYYLKHELKLAAYRIDVNYQSKPKVLTIHVIAKNGQEVYLKPKAVDLFGKMAEHLGLSEWIFKFAERK